MIVILMSSCIKLMEVAMSRDEDHTRRWLINAGGAAILSTALPVDASYAQTAAAAPPRATRDLAEDPATDSTPVSPLTTALAD
jgi:hypothetical protein